MRDAGFEPDTSVSEVWRATNVAITSPFVFMYAITPLYFFRFLNVLTVRIVARSTWDLKKICKSDAKSSVRQIGCFKIRVGQ